MASSLRRPVTRIPRVFSCPGHNLVSAYQYSTASVGRNWDSVSPGTNVGEDEIARLAASRRRPLSLGDLLK